MKKKVTNCSSCWISAAIRIIWNHKMRFFQCSDTVTSINWNHYNTMFVYLHIYIFFSGNLTLIIWRINVLMIISLARWLNKFPDESTHPKQIHPNKFTEHFLFREIKIIIVHLLSTFTICKCRALSWQIQSDCVHFTFILLLKKF